MLPLILAVMACAEGDLMARLQNRDPQALAELYDRYGSILYGVILRIVQDSGIAEDLVQETFLRVWNHVGGFDSTRGAAAPWLLTVARNRALDYVRCQGKRMRNTVELNETEHPSLFIDLKSDNLRFDTVNQVKSALARLAANHREALELAYFEGMSQTQIAERMGQPLGTVKTWMRRALQQLREDLGGALPA
ncbi:MAG: sigma-70 family RNA polymerase sigma factor [Acidobacteria bacterium]|nr:sigma-70 family RNA polymerase sigma factor [Acidobacteriota bacterium]